jgi:predicted dehydrogenase
MSVRSDRSSVATRRTFLKATAAIAAAPYLVQRSALGVTAPSNRLNVGFIGLGNQSTIDLPAFLGKDDVQVLAVCDVNTASHGYKTPDQFLGRKPGQEKVNEYYAEKKAKGEYRGCDAYTDFRELIGRSDIDVVVIIVPDHWHAVMTVMAAKAGKDIYCEKPMSLCIAQGQQMVQAVRKYKRILQVGSMWRSSPMVRYACELVRNGKIGQLKKIECYLPSNNATSPGPGWKPMPVPEGFDYDMWLGPAPQAPYHEDRCFYRFRFILDYSGGQVTNFGAHQIDIAQFGMGTDNTGPLSVEPILAEWPPKGSLFTTALKSHFRMQFANGVQLDCLTKEPPGAGTRFEGTEGWLQIGSKGLDASSDALKNITLKPDEIHLPVSNPERKKHSSKDMIPDHVRNFLDAVKSRQDPIESVEAGHRSASICHLGNIAMLLNRPLKWDPEKEQFVGDAEANGMLARPQRAPWQIEKLM